MSEELSRDSDGAAHVHAIGGELCLDFANTVSASDSEEVRDRLADYGDLVSWSHGIDMLADEVAMHLRREASRRPAQAAAVLQRAIDLREALHRIFVAQTQGLPPASVDLDYLNEELGQAMAHLRLQPGQTCCVWAWEPDSRALDQVLWPIVRSAADLLTSDELDRVRVCEGDRCGWLFVDRSKNRSRRWCDMKDCGNLAKVRRYRRRQKTAS